MSRSIKQFTVEDILSMTNNGLDIFERELGPINPNRNILSPFKKESNPSCRVKPSSTSGIWILTCYNDDNWVGNAISFIQKYYNMSFKEAMDYIINGQNLSRISPIIQSENIKRIQKKEPLLYEFNEMPFTKKHHKYWNDGGLSEQFLRENGDIYAVKIWAINKKVQPIDKDNIVFAYVYKDRKGNETGHLKFLTIGPNVSKKDKWRTNLPNTKLWYLYKIKEDCKQVLIAKSNKDALINDMCGICSIATQSENAVILSKNIPKLQKVFPETNFIINFGSDEQGKNSSIEVSKEHNLQWFNTPNNVLINGVNDNFEYVKQFGIENYKKLLKKKKYL